MATVTDDGNERTEEQDEADQKRLDTAINRVKARMPAESGDVARWDHEEVIVAETTKADTLLQTDGARVDDDRQIAEK